MNHEPVTIIDLVRHGEAGDGEPRFRGRTDDPLSERGWAQLRAVVPPDPSWDTIFSSPLRRCAEFAGELNHRFGLPVELESDLAEMNFGDWDGMSVARVQALSAEALGRFWTDPDAAAAPNGESLSGFYERVSAAWQALVTRVEGRHVLVVAHGGVIRVILAVVLGMPRANLWRMEVPNAACSQVRFYGRRPVLMFLNRIKMTG